MRKAGILMHIRHLGTVGWQKLVWGVPEEDSLGSLPKVVELLLDAPAGEPITTVVFGCGPSVNGAESEGNYTKRYLLEHLDKLRNFPRFAERLDDKALRSLHKMLEDTIVLDMFERSIDEVVLASRIFQEHEVTRIYQVTAASHAPRCAQIQAAARAQGLVPKTQQWFLVADDRCYEGTDPFSTAVFESPHRGDDPMYGYRPSLPEVMKSYQYGLIPDDKKKLISLLAAFMQENATDNDVRNFGVPKK